MTTNSIQTLQDTSKSTPVTALLRRVAAAYVAAYEPRDANGHVVDSSRLLRVPPPA